MFHSTSLKRILVIASFFSMTGIAVMTDFQPLSDVIISEAMAEDNIVLDTNNFPMKGNKDAIVTIIEFSDFQCPFCSRAVATLDELLNVYPNEIRLGFGQLPLAFHSNADSAARASYAAWKQGKFWEMHDLLFENQRELSRDFYIEKAKELGLDISRFESDMDSSEATQYIERSKKDSSQYGIAGTPSFLINGTVFVGAQPLDKFKEVVDKEIDRAKKVAKDKKLKGDALYRELVKTAPKPDNDDDKAKADDVAKRYYVRDGKSPVLGDKNAPITIVEFTDFQCPFCKRANDTLHTLITNNPGKVRVIFKHYPLAFHKNAKLAHQAAEAAKNQKKFWEYHDILFANSDALERDNLIEYAERLNLNMKKFVADMDSEKTIKIVEDDIKEGSDCGVNGTPHFLFNGSGVSGAQPLDKFQKKLDSELALTKNYKKLKGTKLYEKIVKDAPDPAKIEIEVGNSPVLGKAKAPVAVFVFADFQCPFSKKLKATLSQIMEESAYKDKINIVFKNLPLDFHADAQKAAEAAMFAHKNGKFWQMYDAIFDEEERDLSIEGLKRKAAQIGLDPNKLEAALETNQFEEVVKSDVKTAASIDISGTPTMVINGELVIGAQPIEKIKEKIDKAIADSKAKSGKKK